MGTPFVSRRSLKPKRPLPENDDPPRAMPRSRLSPIAVADRASRLRKLAVDPVRLRERTVSLLYADNGDDALAGSSIAALEALCETTTAAYERLLLASRQYI